MKTIEIEGIPGGDGECFVMYISKEQYIKLKGQDAYEDEIAYHTEFYEHARPEEVPPVRLRVYPEDIIKTNKPIRLILTYEEL